MNPAEKFEQARLKGLHADADTVDTGVAIAKEMIAIDRAGIGFQGDFAICLDRKSCRRPSEKFADAFRFKGRRRAAAKENTLHSAALPIGGLSIVS